jgi:nitric oxide reductase NorQ protein
VQSASGVDDPFYLPVGNEVEVFDAAFRGGLPIMLKGPTGCGKTRLVEHMAKRLAVPLYTVSCHEDITASDLIGRYVLQGGETVWVDGPLTIAARHGGICYLDEIVEARSDSTVAIHSLADHRRELSLERQGNVRIDAARDFCLVVSYNPGYQSILKDLKVSTRQRLIALELGWPPPGIEEQILVRESGVTNDVAAALVRLGQAIRRLEDDDLREVASPRALVSAGTLVTMGLSMRDAAIAAIVGPLTDEPSVRSGLMSMVDAYLGGPPIRPDDATPVLTTSRVRSSVV